MKKLIVITGLMLALCLSSFVQAGELTLNTTLNGYQGNGAYLAIYLTDAKGKYHRTLWVAGSKRKYYKHLPDWARGSSLKISECSILSVSRLRDQLEALLSILTDWINRHAHTSIIPSQPIGLNVSSRIQTAKSAAINGSIKVINVALLASIDRSP